MDGGDVQVNKFIQILRSERLGIPCRIEGEVHCLILTPITARRTGSGNIGLLTGYAG